MERCKTRNLLANVDVFRELSEAELETVASLGWPVLMSVGEEFGPGDESGGTLYAVIRGEAQLSSQTRRGDLSARRVGPRDSFPLAALLVEPHDLITAGRALTDVELFAIPLPDLLQLCSRDTATGMKIYRETARLFADMCDDTLGQLAGATERVLRANDYSPQAAGMLCMFCCASTGDDVDLYPVGREGHLQALCSDCLKSWTNITRRTGTLLTEDSKVDQQGRA